MVLLGKLCPEQHLRTAKNKEKKKREGDLNFNAVYEV